MVPFITRLWSINPKLPVAVAAMKSRRFVQMDYKELLKREQLLREIELKADEIVTDALIENQNKLKKLESIETKDIYDDYSPSTPESHTKSTHNATNYPKIHLLFSAIQNTTGQLYSSFLGMMTKRGKCQDAILARVNTRLKLKLKVDNPIKIAIDSVKPTIQYRTILGKKTGIPKVLEENKRNNIAIKWLIESASNRKYGAKRNLEKGLFDEVMAIYNGTSSLYMKRYQMHKQS